MTPDSLLPDRRSRLDVGWGTTLAIKTVIVLGARAARPRSILGYSSC